VFSFVSEEHRSLLAFVISCGPSISVGVELPSEDVGSLLVANPIFLSCASLLPVVFESLLQGLAEQLQPFNGDQKVGQSTTNRSDGHVM
jgi:hypothetical protein